jgi:cytochrome c5
MMLKTIIVCLMFVLPAYGADDSYREEIRTRIAPVGVVELDQVKTTVVAEKPKPLAPGEATYKQYCTVCHSIGVAGAPKKGDKKDWQPRQKKGLEKLVQSAIKGIAPNMPAKGTCGECSAEQIKAAILYMLPK